MATTAVVAATTTTTTSAVEAILSNTTHGFTCGLPRDLRCFCKRFTNVVVNTLSNNNNNNDDDDDVEYILRNYKSLEYSDNNNNNEYSHPCCIESLFEANKKLYVIKQSKVSAESSYKALFLKSQRAVALLITSGRNIFTPIYHNFYDKFGAKKIESNNSLQQQQQQQFNGYDVLLLLKNTESIYHIEFENELNFEIVGRTGNGRYYKIKVIGIHDDFDWYVKTRKSYIYLCDNPHKFSWVFFNTDPSLCGRDEYFQQEVNDKFGRGFKTKLTRKEAIKMKREFTNLLLNNNNNNNQTDHAAIGFFNPNQKEHLATILPLFRHSFQKKHIIATKISSRINVHGDEENIISSSLMVNPANIDYIFSIKIDEKNNIINVSARILTTNDEYIYFHLNYIKKKNIGYLYYSNFPSAILRSYSNLESDEYKKLIFIQENKLFRAGGLYDDILGFIPWYKNN